MDRTICLAVFLLCLVSLFAAGCGDSGPELGEVTGIITLDGKPVDKATVEFQPGPGGSPSSATTDEKGYYELMFGVDRPGAMVGEHIVRISTHRQDREHDDGPVITYPETVPLKYNEESELEREVKSGSQEINFDLKSK